MCIFIQWMKIPISLTIKFKNMCMEFPNRYKKKKYYLTLNIFFLFNLITNHNVGLCVIVSNVIPAFFAA